MYYAFDTGYFFSLIDRPDDVVQSAWRDLRDDTATGVVAGVVLYELKRHALVGRLSAATVDTLVATADEAFRILWMDTTSQADRAARLAYGEGLSMADALVLMGALDTKATRLYTGDSDLLALDGFESLDIIEV
jgi:predicted nucleic acid-binding protein